MSFPTAIPFFSQSTATQTVDEQGQVVLDKSGPLTRLNYFDGKFLRATDLQQEQAALLSQVRLANQAAGGGLIHGFDCTQAGGDSVNISAGLAYDWQGRALLLSQQINLSLGDLLTPEKGGGPAGLKKGKKGNFAECEVSKARMDDPALVVGEQYYLLVISHVEGFCGEEDVYGKLCSEACISSTQRTHIVEGIRISTVPLVLNSQLKTSTSVTLTQKHLRSRLVSAFYAQEQGTIASLISQQGLSANTWCLGAEGLSGQGVAIAMFARKGSSTLFLDAWGARRERMETPPELYWAGRIGMRAKQVFLAQILQFQCQLRECLGNYQPDTPPPASDPCADEKALLQSAAGDMKQLLRFYADVSTRLTTVSSIPFAKIATLDVKALKASIGRLEAAGVTKISRQLLIDCGIVELPSAGYLPVVGDSAITINQQVRQLLGDGVDLRFCSVRPDYVHHAIEEARHLERICLLTGLDDAEHLQEVDILVPDGVIQQGQAQATGQGYQAHLDSSETIVGMGLHIVGRTFREALESRRMVNEVVSKSISKGRKVEFTNVRLSTGRLHLDGTMTGAARADLQGNGPALFLATENSFTTTVDNNTISGDVNFWAQMQSQADLFSLSVGGRCDFTSRFIMDLNLAFPISDRPAQIDTLVDLSVSGQVIVEAIDSVGDVTTINGRFIGDCLVRSRNTTNGETDSQVENVALNDTMTLTQTQTQQGTDIRIRIPSPALFGDLDVFEMIYEQTHNGAGDVVVSAYLLSRVQGEEQRIDFLSGRLVKDDGVLVAGNQFYTKSTTAINNIASAMDNAGFAEVANNLLFPPPQVVEQDTQVSGPYPWVVFHRRRDRHCGQTQAPVVVAPARDYQVYQVTVDANVTREQLLASIERGFDHLVSEANAIEVAMFAANSQVITSSHETMLTRWSSQVEANSEVLASVIASRGDVLGEGSALASSRLLSSNNLLDSVAQFDGQVPLMVRETVPTNLAIGEADGAIVYFTRPASVNTDCHAVYHVVSDNPDDVERQIQDGIAKYQAGATDVTFNVVFNSDIARRLPVSPKFVEGAADFADQATAEQLKEAWKASGGELVTHSAALYPASTPQIGEVAAQQRDTIIDTLGIVEPEPGEHRAAIAVPEGMLDDCKRATVLLVASQCHQVYMVASARRNEILIPGAQVSEANIKQVDELFAEFDTGYRPGQLVYYDLGEAEFYWDDSRLMSRSEQQFANNWQTHLEANPQLANAISQAPSLNGYSVVRLTVDPNGNTSSDPSVDQARGQAAAMHGLLNSSRPAVFVAQQSDNQRFPTSCPVVTFILLDPLTDSPAIGNFTRVVRFNQNNELIRGPQFETAIKAFAESGEKVDGIEVAYDNDGDKKAAELRAKVLKAALVEQGLANRNTKVKAIQRERNDSPVRRQVNLVMR